MVMSRTVAPHRRAVNGSTSETFLPIARNAGPLGEAALAGLQTHARLAQELDYYDPMEKSVPSWRQSVRFKAKAIVEGRHPWPRELVAWKALKELRYFHSETTDWREPPWCREENMTPPQIAFERLKEKAMEKRARAIMRGRFAGETHDEFEERLDRETPHPNALSPPARRPR